MQILFVFLFAIPVLASTSKILSPASIPETWSLPSNSSSSSTALLPLTDSNTIAKTVSIVDQKSGAIGRPNQPVPKTFITAVDGKLILPSTASSPDAKSSRDVSLLTRSATDYELVFNGTGLSSNARDAAIQGTAYLTFSLIPNSTYNVQGCLRFCDSVPGCTFANLYYEFTNDASNSDLSNLKCVLYADIHTADEKTYWGSSSPQTYIQHSSGWSVKTVNDPDTPQGYEYVFGPTNASNSAYGYMGFVFLDRYDVSACAQECNKRNPNSVSGACQYFNIWRAVVNGTPTTYSCSMYSHTTDATSATNTGHGSLKVTLSRGYKRINYIIDGSFEIFPPTTTSLSSCPYTFFCYLPSSAAWTGLSSPTGNLDAAVFLYQPLAHFGITFGLLGSATLSDSLPGTLTPSSPLRTLPSKNYTIGFFHSSSFSSPESEEGAFVDVLWNGKVVRTIRPGWSTWKYYTVEVLGKGQDEIAFHGGSAPAWSFIDDISVYEV